jgi:hypothetical protein
MCISEFVIVAGVFEVAGVAAPGARGSGDPRRQWGVVGQRVVRSSG